MHFYKHLFENDSNNTLLERFSGICSKRYLLFQTIFKQKFQKECLRFELSPDLIQRQKLQIIERKQ